MVKGERGYAVGLGSGDLGGMYAQVLYRVIAVVKIPFSFDSIFGI